jgi:hypothetical protein
MASPGFAWPSAWTGTGAASTAFTGTLKERCSLPGLMTANWYEHHHHHHHHHDATQHVVLTFVSFVCGSQNIYSPGPHYKQLHNIRTGHSRNIFCAKFVPYTNDNTYGARFLLLPPALLTGCFFFFLFQRSVVSCGMDGEIRCTQLGRERTSALIYSSPMHMVLKMSFLPGSGSVFLSTHQDGAF